MMTGRERQIGLALYQTAIPVGKIRGHKHTYDGVMYGRSACVQLCALQEVPECVGVAGGVLEGCLMGTCD